MEAANCPGYSCVTTFKKSENCLQTTGNRQNSQHSRKKKSTMSWNMPCYSTAKIDLMSNRSFPFLPQSSLNVLYLKIFMYYNNNYTPVRSVSDQHR